MISFLMELMVIKEELVITRILLVGKQKPVHGIAFVMLCGPFSCSNPAL